MKLAIVGSTILVGSSKAYNVIFRAISHWRPELVISGGAKGIDSMAKEFALKMGVPVQEFLPAEPNWERGYRPRNLLIAKNCDVLLRIVSRHSRTYGSGWTRDRAREFGKRVHEYRI